MNPQKNSAVIFIIIIVAIIIGALGYYFISKESSGGNSANYTASTTDSVSAATTTASASSVAPIDMTGWKTYSDYELGFSLKYPKNLALNTSLKLTGNNTPASVTLWFPKDSYFSTVLKDEAVVAVYVQPTCAAIDAGLATGSPKNIRINGITFVRNEFHDAAAGNLYETITYDTIRNNACYRITFFVHGANGAGLYLSDPAQIKTADDKHDAELDFVTRTFTSILSTFKFVDTPAGESETVHSPASSASTTSSQNGGVPGPDAHVVLTSVTPNTISTGGTVTLLGSAFSGHDTLVWISDGSTKAVIWGGMPQTDSLISFEVPAQACTQYTGASGLACPSYLILRPGIYTLSVANQFGTSKELYLRIN